MNALNLKVAVGLVNAALAAGRKINAAPLTVAVLDAAGAAARRWRQPDPPGSGHRQSLGCDSPGQGSRLLALDAAAAGVLPR